MAGSAGPGALPAAGLGRGFAGPVVSCGCRKNAMTRDFTPRVDILPLPQRRLWDEPVAVPVAFVLCGDTALALHLGHRESVDFDFFGGKPLDPARLVPAVPFVVGAVVTRREPDRFGSMVDRGGAISRSFFLVPGLRRLLPPLVAPGDGLNVASLFDLAWNQGQCRAGARRGERLHRYRCVADRWKDRFAFGIGCGAGDLWGAVCSTKHVEGAVLLRRR